MELLREVLGLKKTNESVGLRRKNNYESIEANLTAVRSEQKKILADINDPAKFNLDASLSLARRLDAAYREIDNVTAKIGSLSIREVEKKNLRKKVRTVEVTIDSTVKSLIEEQKILFKENAKDILTWLGKHITLVSSIFIAIISLIALTYSAALLSTFGISLVSHLSLAPDIFFIGFTQGLVPVLIVFLIAATVLESIIRPEIFREKAVQRADVRETLDIAISSLKKVAPGRAFLWNGLLVLTVFFSALVLDSALLYKRASITTTSLSEPRATIENSRLIGGTSSVAFFVNTDYQEISFVKDFKRYVSTRLNSGVAVPRKRIVCTSTSASNLNSCASTQEQVVTNPAMYVPAASINVVPHVQSASVEADPHTHTAGEIIAFLYRYSKLVSPAEGESGDETYGGIDGKIDWETFASEILRCKPMLPPESKEGEKRESFIEVYFENGKPSQEDIQRESDPRNEVSLVLDGSKEVSLKKLRNDLAVFINGYFTAYGKAPLINVVGFASNSSSMSNNFDLSERRAQWYREVIADKVDGLNVRSVSVRNFAVGEMLRLDTGKVVDDGSDADDGLRRYVAVIPCHAASSDF